ncbi:MAG: hypothetical protein ACJA07_001506 [Rhodococcus sp. (in: high G+C Gram-positive bacteria)]|jgi:hypothetical protein
MAREDEPKGDPGAQAADVAGKGYWPLFGVAIALVVVFLALSVWLFTAANDEGTTEIVWSRYAYIVGGLEAIVFAAVGWLFGREVNRGTAEVAKKQADAATQAADAAKGKAAAGNELAGVVRGFLATQGSSGGIETQTASGLKYEVDRLFPLDAHP